MRAIGCFAISVCLLSTSVLVDGRALSAGDVTTWNQVIDRVLAADGLETTEIIFSSVDVEDFDGEKYSIIAPTNEAWLGVPEYFLDKVINGEDLYETKRLVECHVVVDPDWSAKIQELISSGEGEYSAETLGGCSVSAFIQAGGVVVTSEYGDGGAVSQKIPGLISMNGVFIPPGTETGTVIRSSRLFAGPSNFPPESFGAYGIVLFKSRATTADRPRHNMFCEAYVASLPHQVELAAIPMSEQLGTVWPVSSDVEAGTINRLARSEVCTRAVDHYGLVVARQALIDAELAGARFDGRGPFLVAWAPPRDKGSPAAIVLVYDLSPITTSQQAIEAMEVWKDAIEGDSDLWKAGFDLNYVRLKVQYVFDELGVSILSVVGK